MIRRNFLKLLSCIPFISVPKYATGGYVTVLTGSIVSMNHIDGKIGDIVYIDRHGSATTMYHPSNKMIWGYILKHYSLSTDVALIKQ